MKRSKEAIITQILELCTEGASKTKIVYQVNLNFKTLVPYIELLIKNNLLLSERESIVIYRTTPKGERLLNELKSIRVIIPEIYNRDEKSTA